MDVKHYASATADFARINGIDEVILLRIENFFWHSTINIDEERSW